MNRAIFLDRDNTLIHNDGDLGDPSQVKLIQGVASAIASLRGLGYRIIVVSNQGGVARGKFTEAEVEATNARINDLIVQISGAGIDRFYYCPYHPQGTVEKYRSEHPWRKPQPGMLLQAAKDMQLEMGQSWMVGDQLRDVEAGAAAGVRTILLTPQAGAAQPPLLQDRMAVELLGQPADKNSEGKKEKPKVMPDFVARNLIEAVRIIAQQRRPEGVDDWRSLEPAKSPRPLPVALSPATQRLSQTTTPQPTTPMASADANVRTTPSTTATENKVTTSAMTPTPATGATSTIAVTLTTGSPSTARSVASTPAATPAPAAATEVASTKPVEEVGNTSPAAHMKPVRATSADIPSVSSTPVTSTTPAMPSALVATPTASASDTDTTSAREPGITVSKPFTRDIAATTSTTMVATPPTTNESQIITVTAPTDDTLSTSTSPMASVIPSPTPSPSTPVATTPLSPTAPSSAAASASTPQAVATPSQQVTATPAPRAVQPMVSPTLPATVSSPSMEQTLRQILAELRNQRQPVDEFNYTGVLAIVFQLLAVVCLLAALWMGRGDDGLFLRWMGVSLLTQLIAIAMLLFKR